MGARRAPSQASGGHGRDPPRVERRRLRRVEDLGSPPARGARGRGRTPRRRSPGAVGDELGQVVAQAVQACRSARGGPGRSRARGRGTPSSPEEVLQGRVVRLQRLLHAQEVHAVVDARRAPRAVSVARGQDDVLDRGAAQGLARGGRRPPPPRPSPGMDHDLLHPALQRGRGDASATGAAPRRGEHGLLAEGAAPSAPPRARPRTRGCPRPTRRGWPRCRCAGRSGRRAPTPPGTAWSLCVSTMCVPLFVCPARWYCTTRSAGMAST